MTKYDPLEIITEETGLSRGEVMAYIGNPDWNQQYFPGFCSIDWRDRVPDKFKEIWKELDLTTRIVLFWGAWSIESFIENHNIVTQRLLTRRTIITMHGGWSPCI